MARNSTSSLTEDYQKTFIVSFYIEIIIIKKSDL